MTQAPPAANHACRCAGSTAPFGAQRFVRSVADDVRSGPSTLFPRVPRRHGEGDREHLSSLGGLAALSLDALSSVAYGPEAIVLVLVAAGTSSLSLTLRRPDAQ